LSLNPTIEELIEENRRLTLKFAGWPTLHPEACDEAGWKAPFSLDIWYPIESWSDNLKALKELHGLVQDALKYVENIRQYFSWIREDQAILEQFQQCGRGHGLIDLVTVPADRFDRPGVLTLARAEFQRPRPTSKGVRGADMTIILEQHLELLEFVAGGRKRRHSQRKRGTRPEITRGG
jgi:hypothetical protein